QPQLSATKCRQYRARPRAVRAWMQHSGAAPKLEAGWCNKATDASFAVSIAAQCRLPKLTQLRYVERCLRFPDGSPLRDRCESAANRCPRAPMTRECCDEPRFPRYRYRCARRLSGFESGTTGRVAGSRLARARAKTTGPRG